MHQFWLASYPKSGNTWLRLFLCNLLFPEQAPVSIDALPLAAPIASSRSRFDRLLGVPSALLTPDEIAALRPVADAALAVRWQGPLLVRKVHDAWSPALLAAPHASAIYVARDPCDVAVSLAHARGWTFEEAARRLCDENHWQAARTGALDRQLPHRLGAWDAHALGWLAAPMPVHWMRYEAMRAAPLDTFRAAVRFLGLAHDDAAIAAAVTASRFERLQAEEAATGFREAPAGRRFFRSGTSGEGAHRLAPETRARLDAMRERVDAAVAARAGPA